MLRTETHASDRALDMVVPVERVLVVDDDPDINRLLKTRLTTRGYQVDTAANGEEALARLADTTPDLLFLDVSMPGIGGLEVLDQIRARQLDMAVIMTTAFGSEQIAIDALRRGADDYLRKPFETSEFRSVLERTVTRLTLSRQNAVLRRQLDAKRRQLEVELTHAAAVQADLLPGEVPVLPGFELAAECAPALEVGGDFYDWQVPAPGVLTLWLCDVMGKGMPAALLMATVRAVMRAVVRGSLPAEALCYVARALTPDLLRSDRFVTLFLGHLDTASRCLTYVDAGHGLAMLRRADGSTETLAPRGLPLGVLPDEVYQEGLIAFAPGDALVLYSDGLIDARPDLNIDPQFLSHHLDGTTSALAMVDRLVALLASVGVPSDDFTVVVLYCSGRD